MINVVNTSISAPKQQKDDYFRGFIGQEKVKNKLSFYIDAYKKTGFFPTLGIISSRGTGKTALSRLIAKNLTNPDTGKPKEYLEINGTTIRGLDSFVNDVVQPYMTNGRKVCVLFDESHNIHKDVEQFLLSVINPTIGNKTSAIYNGRQYDFDFHTLTCFFCTTSPEKHSKPFLSRLKRVEFKHYTEEDLAEMTRMANKGIDFLDRSEYLLASVSRNNPRMVTELSKDVEGYCKVKGQNSFDKDDWPVFCEKLNIYPLGLTETEVECLKFLNVRGPQTLTAIAAYLSLDSTTVRVDCEAYLLAKNLIVIDGKRRISNIGVDILSKIL